MKKLLTTKNFMITLGVLLSLVVAWFLPMAAPGIFYAFTLPAGRTFDQHIKGIKEVRAAKSQEMQKMIDKALKEKREMNEDEEKRYESLKAERYNLAQELELAEEAFAQERGKPSRRIGEPDNDGVEENISAGFQILKKVKEDRARPLTDFVLRNYDVKHRANPYEVLLSLIDSKRRVSREAEKARTELRSVTGGSNMFDNFLSAQILDDGISKSRAAQAGMRVMPMEAETHRWAKITGYPTASWATKGSSVSDETATIDAVTATAKTLRASVRVDGEDLAAKNMEQVLRLMWQTSIGNSLDTAALLGSGSGAEPKGVKNFDNVNSYSMGANGGAISHYDPFIEITKLILDDNGEVPSHCILSTREWKTLEQLKDNDDNPLVLPRSMQSLSILETSKIPTDLDAGTATGVASVMIFGGFDSLYLPTLLETQIIVTPVLAQTYQYDVLAVTRADVVSERDENFGIITNIIP